MGVKMGNESDLKEAIITRYLLGIFRKWYRSDNGKNNSKTVNHFQEKTKRQTKFGREKSHYHTIT